MRLLSLDVLRGVAVLLVIVRHSPAAAGTLLAPIHRGGWIGVDIFFVLSGFLVSGLLFREYEKTGTIQPLRFLVRRGWKIYPPFWAFLAVSVITTRCEWSPTISRLTSELTFTQNYREGIWGHTWSLAIEEHFYLILPFMLLLMAKTRFAALPRTVLAIMVGLLLARCINGLRPYSYATHVFPTHLRIDGLFFGVLLSHWYHGWPAFVDFGRRHAGLLIACGAAMFVPATVWSLDQTPALYTYGLSLHTIAAGAILMGMVCGGVPATILTRAIGGIGVYSYSIYLWHVMVTFFFQALPVPITLSFSVLLGIAMSRMIETPSLKLRDWLMPARHMPRIVQQDCLPGGIVASR